MIKCPNGNNPNEFERCREVLNYKNYLEHLESCEYKVNKYLFKTKLIFFTYRLSNVCIAVAKKKISGGKSEITSLFANKKMHIYILFIEIQIKSL